MTVLRRQELLAAFLDDPTIEDRVRTQPEQIAEREGVPLEFVRWLAGISPLRVAAFRRSRVHKDRLRAGGTHE
jgi:hypothetical protein